MTITIFSQYRTLATSQDMIKPVLKSTKASISTHNSPMGHRKKGVNFLSMGIYRTLDPPGYNCTDLKSVALQGVSKYIFSPVNTNLIKNFILEPHQRPSTSNDAFDSRPIH